MTLLLGMNVALFFALLFVLWRLWRIHRVYDNILASSEVLSDRLALYRIEVLKLKGTVDALTQVARQFEAQAGALRETLTKVQTLSHAVIDSNRLLITLAGSQKRPVAERNPHADQAQGQARPSTRHQENTGRKGEKTL